MLKIDKFSPWGTPEVTSMEEDILPSRRTCCVRLDKNECIQLSACGEMLYTVRVCRVGAGGELCRMFFLEI